MPAYMSLSDHVLAARRVHLRRAGDSMNVMAIMCERQFSWTRAPRPSFS